MKGIGRGGINSMMTSQRGRGGGPQGMMPPGMGRGGPMMMGQYGNQGKVPYEGYTCKRCGIKGHFINDCPKNNDRNYDPSRSKGVPKN